MTDLEDLIDVDLLECCECEPASIPWWKIVFLIWVFS